MINKLLSATAMMAIVMTPACGAQGSKIDTSDKAAIEKIVRDYIVANPEVIEEALIALADKEKAASAARIAEAVKANAADLYKNASDYAIGPADAPITVVEFFDYRCGYCKRSTDWIQALPEAYDGKVRVVFKELPIFGGISETASLAALAAGKQDKYVDMHLALMGVKNNDDLTDKEIDVLARKVGVDVQKMRADMRSMDVQKQLADMKSLGRELGVAGTPGFFVGDTVIEGADRAKLEAAIKAML